MALSLQMALSHAVYLRADCLTKRGVKADALLDVITSGFLPREDEKKMGGEDERRVV